jgi:hypothetical protein
MVGRRPSFRLRRFDNDDTPATERLQAVDVNVGGLYVLYGLCGSGSTDTLRGAYAFQAMASGDLQRLL